MNYGNYANDYDAWVARFREAPRSVAKSCDACLDEIYEGDDVWIAEETDEHDGFVACSISCMAEFTVKYEIDIDEFVKQDAE